MVNGKKIMFRSFSLICLILLALTCKGQGDTTACREFSRGDFIYTNDDGHEVHVTRKYKTQVETNKTTGVKTRFKVKWISSCVYEIKQLWSDSKANRKMNSSVTRVQIASAAANSYTFVCVCKGLEASKKGIMIRKS